MRFSVIVLLAFVLPSAHAQMKLVQPLPADPSISALHDVNYRTVDRRTLKFDLYRPTGYAPSAPLRLAIFLNGTGNPEMRGWGQYTGWGRLVTTVGLAGVVFDTHPDGIGEDLDSLMEYLREHRSDLHVDPDSTVLFACSANARAGLPIVMDKRRTYLKAAVIYYGAGPVEQFRLDLPVFYVRAGLDGVGMNREIDQLVSRAVAANAPLTFVNFGAGHHGFDLVDDNDISREIIAQSLEFMRSRLEPGFQQTLRSDVTEASAAAAVYRDEWPAAVSAYEALSAARPTDSEVRRNFGNALLGAGQYARSIEQYERALALGNRNVGWISYSAAIASAKLGDTEGALKWIDNLKDIEPMRKQLRMEPAFSSLRDNPRFKSIAEMN